MFAACSGTRYDLIIVAILLGWLLVIVIHRLSQSSAALTKAFAYNIQTALVFLVALILCSSCWIRLLFFSMLCFSQYSIPIAFHVCVLVSFFFLWHVPFFVKLFCFWQFMVSTATSDLHFLSVLSFLPQDSLGAVCIADMTPSQKLILTTFVPVGTLFFLWHPLRGTNNILFLHCVAWFW